MRGLQDNVIVYHDIARTLGYTTKTKDTAQNAFLASGSSTDTFRQNWLYNLWGSGQNENAGPLLKKYYVFQDNNNRALNQT